MTCHQTTSLGAYVLGSLEESERGTIDAHLLDCPSCAAELAEIERLSPLLDRLTIDDIVASEVTPRADLFDRVAAAARRDLRRQHQRRLLLTSVAAAVIAIAVAAVFGLSGLANHSPASVATGQPVAYAASSGNIHMSVTITGHSSGTDLDVTVAGLPLEEHCQLIAVSRNGSRDIAGSWVATYSGTAQVTGSTTISRSQLAGFVLLGTNGQQLVTVPI